MANEIVFSYDKGSTLYARMFSLTGQVYDDTVERMVNWSDGDVGDYDIPLTDMTSGQYIADFPTAIGQSGRFKINIYKQAGASPAITDTVIGTGEILWSLTAEIHGADEDDVTDAHETTDDLIDTVIGYVKSILNIYDER